MKIQDRLYSESNPEEVLYTVSLTEEEYNLYSEFQKNFGLGTFFKKLGYVYLHPRHICTRIGANIVGGAIAGPLGAFVGGSLANSHAWDEATKKYGHSFS